MTFVPIFSIFDTQCFCVMGSQIHHNIFLVHDLWNVCKRNNEKMGLVCLDQANAFDRVHHMYLFGVLEKLGLGGGFVAYIKLLYNQIYS